MSSNVTPLCGQSWRHVAGMGGSYEQYRPGAWQPCTRPGHHACLNNYPIEVTVTQQCSVLSSVFISLQGNMELLPQFYP